MLELGIKVGLGTDGCASNNSIDMFREMNLLSNILQLNHQTTSLPAGQALRCATINNAALLGLGKTGQLAIGYKADLILLAVQPHLSPGEQLLVAAATGAAVHSVIIDGRLIMHERKILSFDLEDTMREVRRLAGQLAGSRH